MNQTIISQKQAVVNQVKDVMSTTKSLTIVEYRGLTVKQIETLRRELRKEGGELKILKNSLVERAINDLGHKELDQQIAGPNAFVFSHKDAVSAPKVLVKFAKANSQLVIKGGLVEGRVVNEQEMRVVATLPGKEGLLSMLLSCLTSPVRGFACAVKAVAEKQEQN